MEKLLFIVFIVIGCSWPSGMSLHRTMAIDSSFSQEEQELIVQAVSQWENTTNGLVKVDLIFTDTPNFYGNDVAKMVNVKDLNIDFPIVYNKTVVLYGLTTFVSDSVLVHIYTGNINYVNVMEDSYKVNFEEIVLHELGHSFNLHHVSTGLMTPEPHGQTCIDDYTIEQFCDINNCRAGDLKSNCGS